MSHAQTVMKIYELFGRGDVPGILSHLSENIEWEHDAKDQGIPWILPGRGRDNVIAFFKRLSESVDVQEFQPLTPISSGDQVAVPIICALKVKKTGVAWKELEMHLWSFGADGKATRFRHFSDTLQAHRALNP